MLEGLGTVEKGKIVWLGCGQWPGVRLDYRPSRPERLTEELRTLRIPGSCTLPSGPIFYAHSETCAQTEDMGVFISRWPWFSSRQWLLTKGKEVTHGEEL